jgi:hypothetical protein
MPGITLAQAEARLQQYLDAEEAVLSGQAYEIAGRSLRRADLQFIQTGIDTWNKRVQDLGGQASGRGRVVNMCPGG